MLKAKFSPSPVCISLPNRKLIVNANGSFGPEFLGKNSEFNALVTLRPHEILQLQKTLADHLCAVPLKNDEICRFLLSCSSHSLSEKLKVKRSKSLLWLMEKARVEPKKAAHQRNLVRLHLDYRRFWSIARLDSNPKTECFLSVKTCSRQSCESSVEEELPLKCSLIDAYLHKVSKNLGSRMLDFVACVHYRLRSCEDESSRLQEAVLRLAQLVDPA